MSEKTKNVNYELAYRLIMLVIETTEDRHSGSDLNLEHARRILGANQEEFDLVMDTLLDDMVLTVTGSRTLFVG